MFAGKLPLSLRSFQNLRFINISGNTLLEGPLLVINQLEHLSSENIQNRYILAEKSIERNLASAGAMAPSSSKGLNGIHAEAPSPTATTKHKHKKTKRKLLCQVIGLLVGTFAGIPSGSVLYFLFKFITFLIEGEKMDRSLAIFSMLIKNPKDLAFLGREDGWNGLNVIGRGRCGEVYKSTLPGTNGKEIAIKKIIQPSRDAEELAEEDSKHLNKKMRQIRSEIQTSSQIRHRNLLPLLAHLSRPDCHYLVYEYMKNGSLQDVLEAVSEGRRELDWLARYKVAIGVASGLEYLHLNQTPSIIHRDLKPANILLDDEMEAQITDFGLAKAMPEANTHVTTSNVAGTVGYIAPEYYQTSQFTEKCDIYSFGIVLGVLAMGKFPWDDFFQHTDEMTLVGWMRNVMTSDDPKRSIDRRLRGNGYEEQILLVLKIACYCTLDNPKERPDSKEEYYNFQNMKTKRVSGKPNIVNETPKYRMLIQLAGQVEVDADVSHLDQDGYGTGYFIQPTGQIQVDANGSHLDQGNEGEDAEKQEDISSEDDQDGSVQEFPTSSRKRRSSEDNDNKKDLEEEEKKHK
ncbi:leucine-rich repeat receptor-like serine threonine tyrosine- kinase SOBIR1 [Olea europaea subsp. europaea]|uniref:Leucine-rich repeat receptor-like serine threonine tyrosine- kinase SOBIR1 n=1 Tax=Olea europaea subsp. europaea TaxID=158383 RepID=A0A8S0RB29_OLEEU|nr:leucine-rich repeat receptor-like serine threonine tyrosine- kinase SOBIR1 [Olea europaea subsp. europaea]